MQIVNSTSNSNHLSSREQYTLQPVLVVENEEFNQLTQSLTGRHLKHSSLIKVFVNHPRGNMEGDNFSSLSMEDKIEYLYNMTVEKDRIIEEVNNTASEEISVIKNEADQFFLIVIAIIIFFMQCGFAFLEAGAVR